MRDIGIRLSDVGPRDGLQAIRQQPLALKLELARRLQSAYKESLFKDRELAEEITRGTWPYIEIGSFVNYDRVPTMADTPQIVQDLERREGINYGVLVPHVAYLWTDYGSFVPAAFIAAHEEYSQNNMGASIQKVLNWAKGVIEKTKELGLKSRAYVSNIFGYKENGDVKLEDVVNLARQLISFGANEISFGDTTSLATISTIRTFAREITAIFGEKAVLHLHVPDQKQGIQLVEAAIEEGICRFDTSIAGLGGAITETTGGNIDTGLIVRHLERNGIETWLELGQLEQTGRWLRDKLVTSG